MTIVILPWNPAHITTNMIGWWDGADTGTQTFSGGYLTQWRDKSPVGAGSHLTPFTGGPEAATLNGLSALKFWNHGLQTATSYMFADVTVCAAFAPPATASNYERLIDHDVTNGWWIGREATNAVWLGGVLETGPPYGIGVPLANGRAHQISLRRAGTTQDVRGNSGTLATRAITAATTSLQNIAVGTGVDSNLGAMLNYGIIAELVVWNRALSDADMRRMEGYFAHKWGSADLLPSWHPFKSQPPVIYIGSVDPGAVTLSGKSVNFLHRLPTKLSAQTGAITLSGKSVALGFNVGPRMQVQPGTLALAGKPARFERTYPMLAQAGTVTLAGQPVRLQVAHRLAMGTGAIRLTGQDVALRYNVMQAVTGAVTLAGQSIQLHAGRVLTLQAQPGQINLDGKPAAFIRHRVLRAMQSGIVLHGSPVEFRRVIPLPVGGRTLFGQTAYIAGRW